MMLPFPDISVPCQSSPSPFHPKSFLILKVFSKGRPLRVRSNAYIENWETNRSQEIKDLTAKGTIPVEHDFETLGDEIDDETMDNARPFLMGKAAAVVNEKKSAKAIVDEMVGDAVQWLGKGASMCTGSVKSKL